LREAQHSIAERIPGVVHGPNTDRLGLRDRYDSCHFDARGRDAIVEETLEVLMPLIRNGYQSCR
jgi:hypothetical protein